MPDKRDAEPLNPKKEWKQKLPDMHIYRVQSMYI